jgi:hypothetical protein
MLVICLTENTTIAAAAQTYYLGWQLRTLARISLFKGH